MDAHAFDRYFAEKYPVLVGQVAAMWGNRDEASEAFVRAWAKRHEFGRHPFPDAWIRTVARNLLTDGCDAIAGTHPSTMSQPRRIPMLLT